MAMQSINLTLKDHQYNKLKARAARAELPLDIYIIAAAADPMKFAWPDDDNSTIANLNN
jgi:hypothetical protein